MQDLPRLIDFHSHYYAASWFISQEAPAPGALSRAWPMLTNLEAQLGEMDSAGIEAKVLSAPAGSLVDSGQPLPLDLMKRINDNFAELITTYPQRLFALATIDVFQGDTAGDEVVRTIQSLGLHGICIDCAQGDRYLDEPEARPALIAAAKLGVPVFIHPVSPVGLTERLARLGHTGVLLARGTEHSASVLALLRSGLLDDLPDLKVVIPMIGAASLFFAGMAEQEYRREEGWRGSSPSAIRQRLYIDTMGFDPASMRFAIDLLGVEHVLMGSDWPIMPITTRQQVEQLLASLNLSETQQAAISRDNAWHLLTRTGLPG